MIASGGDGWWWGDQNVAGNGINAAVVFCVEGYGVGSRVGEFQKVHLVAGTITNPVNPIGGVGSRSNVAGPAKIPFFGTDGAIAWNVVAACGIAAIGTGDVAHTGLVFRPANNGVGDVNFCFVYIPG